MPSPEIDESLIIAGHWHIRDHYGFATNLRKRGIELAEIEDVLEHSKRFEQQLRIQLARDLSQWSGLEERKFVELSDEVITDEIREYYTH